MPPYTFNMLAICLGTLAVLLALFAALRSWKAARRRREMLAARQNVMDILGQAMSARSHLDVHFTSTNDKELVCRGELLDVGENLLCSFYNTFISQVVLEEKARIFFRMKLDGTSRFFSFTAPVLKVHGTAEQSTVRLGIPEVIEHEQRRNFVRLALDKRLLPYFAAWHGIKPPATDEAQTDCADSLQGSVLSMSALPAQPDMELQSDSRIDAIFSSQTLQQLQWQALPRKGLYAKDISACGLGLQIMPSSSYTRLETGSIIMLQLQLGHAPAGDDEYRKSRTLHLLIVGEVVRQIPCATDNCAGYGIHFQSWTQPVPEKKLAWFSVREDGIPPLGAWVMRRQADLLRPQVLQPDLSFLEPA